MGKYEPMNVKRMQDKYPTQAQGSTELLLLLGKVKGSISGLHFHIASDNVAYAYMRNQPYVLGKLTYGQLQDSTQDYLYGVTSTYVINDKYDPYREQHNTKMTKNVDTAFKLVKRFVRPLSVAEICNQSKTDYSYTLRKRISDTTNLTENTKREFFCDDMVSSIRNLYLSGHDFGEKLNDILHRFIEAENSSTEAQAQSRKTMIQFVHVTDYCDRQMFKVSECHDMFDYGAGDISEPQTYLSTDAPEQLVSKIAALSILNNEDHIAGVGYKVSDELYYVETVAE